VVKKTEGANGRGASGVDLLYGRAAALPSTTSSADIVGDPGLTPREFHVLRSMASGMTAADIANSLTVSRNTARNHIQNILHKLNAHSKTEAVSIALRRGLISLDTAP
jgi:two-component system NarL family response regulator